MFLSGDEIIKIKIIFILGLLYCIFVQNLAFAQPLQYVDKITINIKFSDDLKVPIEIEKRITASTLTIANNVLQGQPLDKINEQKKSYETLFQDVLGRILIGYYVQAVRLDVAEQTVVEVELRPWQDSIQSVEVSLVNNDISEPYQDLINEDLRGIKPVIENLLLGLPIDAVYWASSILKTSLNDYFNNKLPEYNYSLDITEGSHTMVRLSLYPKGLLVKNSVVAIRSQSIPNLAFLKLRAKVEVYLEKLNGLPVEFLKRHKEFFTKEIITLIENDDFLKKIALNKTVVIIPGIKNQVEFLLDSERYNLNIEGRLDLGKQQDNTSFLIHVGKFVAPKQEFFIENQFITNNVKFEWSYGYQYKIFDKTLLGYKYNQSERYDNLYLKQELSDKFLLRVEHHFKTDLNEVALRYKLHEFVSLEYVKNNEDNWLRLVGNF